MTVRALFLDAGNTILGMDYGLMSRWASMAGLLLEAQILERAEAMARPVLSHSLEGGASSEAASSLEVYVAAILRAARELGRHDDESGIPGGFAGMSDEDALRTLLSILREGENWTQLWSAVPRGVQDALVRARGAGLRIVIVSNSDGGVDKKLERAGLRRFCDAIVDSGAAGVEKPDPAIFRIALEHAGCEAHEAVHCGDLEAVDVRGAEAAGIRAVLLDPYGDWRDPGVCARPVTCETARDVPEFVDRVLAECAAQA